MSKDELERYSQRCVLLGVAVTSLGALNLFRGARGNGWAVAGSAGCFTVGLMQFLLAHRLHQRAQRLP